MSVQIHLVWRFFVCKDNRKQDKMQETERKEVLGYGEAHKIHKKVYNKLL